MSFLGKLFGGKNGSADNGFYLYAKCNRCGTPVRTRINLANELAAEYGDDDTEGFTLTKELMDDRCFRIMRATLTFNQQRREIGRVIEGGTFLSAEEYAALRPPTGEPAAASPK